MEAEMEEAPDTNPDTKAEKGKKKRKGPITLADVRNGRGLLTRYKRSRIAISIRDILTFNDITIITPNPSRLF